jgi:hypothetical protein
MEFGENTFTLVVMIVAIAVFVIAVGSLVWPAIRRPKRSEHRSGVRQETLR